MEITREMVLALKDLRTFADAVRPEMYPVEVDRRAQKAIDLLDNADFFSKIDEAGDAFETEGAQAHDPAEWGDTTRQDMADHQEGADARLTASEHRP